MRFSRQEYWSGLLFPSPGDLPHPGIEPVSLECSALAGGFFTTAAPPPPHCLFFPKRHPASKSDVELSLEMAEGVARDFLSFLPFCPVPALPGALLFPSPHLGPCTYVCTSACVLTCLHVCAHMSACVSLHVCVCMCVCMCVCVLTCLHVCVYTGLHVCLCTCMCARVSACFCVHVCLKVCARVCTHGCMCVHVYVCACTECAPPSPHAEMTPPPPSLSAAPFVSQRPHPLAGPLQNHSPVCPVLSAQAGPFPHTAAVWLVASHGFGAWLGLGGQVAGRYLGLSLAPALGASERQCSLCGR